MIITKVRKLRIDDDLINFIHLGPHYRDKRKSSIENANEENQRRYSNQNGGIQSN